ncbi:hypothetical protein [Schaedlerella arabinosiphila]|uniref:hypothetical protein n=1 Tax=Schaedlerella arabinosiphila TaxID=2044587 RepID=UPI002030273B|nr:hypothetical protein [Schaedlerella arabinosiphila]
MTDRQSERSTQSLKPGCGIPGAMMVRGLKDTSSRPAKDLGGTLRYTRKTVLRSYDSSAGSGLLCPHRQGCVANVAKPSKQNHSSRTGRFPAATAAPVCRYGYFLTIE